MFDIAKPFSVSIQGRGTIRLGPQDHVASGGEGHVYRKSGGRTGPSMAIKIWDDPDHAAVTRMTDKIGRLAALKHPWIVVPEALVHDTGGRAVGYVMAWVDAKWEMTLAFTNAWRAANRFGDAEALAFAARMREVVDFVHGHGAIMGDANELNVLGVGSGLAAEPRYIDTDPWVLPGFPGDKILPTIHDYHAAPFSKEADWYAWAVTTFQLLVGVHPYRGTHPGYARTDLETRMRANASVFDAGVRTSPAVRPFSSIPAPLLGYYRAVFQNGHRGPPPVWSKGTATPAQQASAPPRTVAGGNFSLEEKYRTAGRITALAARDVFVLEDDSLISLADGRSLGRIEPGASVIRSHGNTLLTAVVHDELVRFGILQGGPGATAALHASGIAASSCWNADNRLFAVAHDGILELDIRALASGPVALPGRKWNLNPNSTVFGTGLAVYDALGARFLVVPFGGNAVAILRARELDGLKPVAMIRSGRAGSMSLIDTRGNYKRAVMVFSESFSACSIELSDADSGELADAVTDGGILVRFNADGMLELAVPGTGNARLVNMHGHGGRLFAGSAGVFLEQGGKVSRLSVS